MTRAAWLGAAAAVGLAGCLSDEADRGTVRNKPVDLSGAREPDPATAARVDQIGNQLVNQNPFLGVQPMFYTLGRPEPEVGHPDLNGVFVTEGLVAKCRSDAELAAVLAFELGKMAGERRAADRQRAAEPLRPLPDAGVVSAGGVGSDQNQLGAQALVDRQRKQAGHSRPVGPEDPRAAAEGILKAAGFDPAAAAGAEPLVREAGRPGGVADRVGAKAAAPKWSN